uniref:Uncharacterized protein n=1 Tax=Geobacter sp. (strain M21) TaxID=443144 RepID=C6E755_GEOSM
MKAHMIILAILFACVTATLAEAGTQVLINQSTTVKAAVQNTTTRSRIGSIVMTGYDDAGTVIGHLCKNAYLPAGRTTTVEIPWQAPNYPTGVYWSSKVAVNTFCPSTWDGDDDEHDD